MLLPICISHVLIMRMHVSQLLGVHTHMHKERERGGGGAEGEREREIRHKRAKPFTLVELATTNMSQFCQFF